MPSLRRWICSALVAAALSACAERDPGVVVPVTQIHVAGAATFTTDRGYEVTLTRAAITVRTVQITGCAAPGAHSTAVLDFLDAPATLDLLAPPGEEPIGELPARDVAHCGVSVFLAAGDAEPTLVLEGTVSPPGGTPRALSLTTRATATAEFTVAAFVPADGAPRPALRLVHGAVAGWLDGIDLDGASPDEAAAAALAHARATLRAALVVDSARRNR